MRAFRKFTLVGLVMAALLAACLPAQTASNGLQDVQDQVATAVALTVSAQNALTAQAQPTATETFTPTAVLLDLPTLTPVIDTATPFVVVPPSGGGGGGGSKTPNYACDFTNRPRDNTKFRPGDPFEVKWVITNTGAKNWVAGKDLRYYSGPLMTSIDLVELPAVKSGHTYSVSLGADAPDTKGFNVMTWVVEGGLCYPYVAIDVEDNR